MNLIAGRYVRSDTASCVTHLAKGSTANDLECLKVAPSQDVPPYVLDHRLICFAFGHRRDGNRSIKSNQLLVGSLVGWFHVHSLTKSAMTFSRRISDDVHSSYSARNESTRQSTVSPTRPPVNSSPRRCRRSSGGRSDSAILLAQLSLWLGVGERGREREREGERQRGGLRHTAVGARASRAKFSAPSRHNERVPFTAFHCPCKKKDREGVVPIAHGAHNKRVPFYWNIYYQTRANPDVWDDELKSLLRDTGIDVSISLVPIDGLPSSRPFACAC